MEGSAKKDNVKGLINSNVWSWINYKHINLDVVEKLKNKYLRPVLLVTARCANLSFCEFETLSFTYSELEKGRIILKHLFTMSVEKFYNKTGHIRLNLNNHYVNYQFMNNGLENSTEYRIINESFDQRIVYYRDELAIVWGCDQIEEDKTNQSLAVYSIHLNSQERHIGIEKEVNEFIKSKKLSGIFLSAYERRIMECNPSEINGRKESESSGKYPKLIYPFAVVLRLRVLQIICGIAFLIIGTVAFIEEKGEFNLGLGIPAGAVTVLAAAFSIHTTRGFSGYKTTSPCLAESPLRFLGPTIRLAALLTILWATSCVTLIALIVQASRTLTQITSNKNNRNGDIFDIYKRDHLPTRGSYRDITILACVELILAIITLGAVAALVRIDCKYDPD